MTKEEIINFIQTVLAANPNSFTECEIIEDNYIYLPSIEFVKNPDTDEWTPI